MHLPSQVKKPAYIVGAVLVMCAVAIAIFGITVNDQWNRLQDAKREATASHWAAAGLQNPATTLTDGGNKRTVGVIGKCAVTVEGFSTYTTLVAVNNGDNPTTRIEFNFQPGTGRGNPDDDAFSYIRNLTQVAPFCSKG